MSGIYLHIPFCKQACSYCDFYFVTRRRERGSFVERLQEEIHGYSGTPYAGEPVQTIYFGGGTPSLLSPEQLEHILDALQEVFDLQLEEVTLEMNPDDVTAGYLRSLRELGINRASMGVQSFKPELLEMMHRAHSREEALRCVELLKKSNFNTFTVDLIYGNPGQTLGELEEDVEQLLSFDPMHISAYSLTIESRTRLGKQVELGRIAPPEDDKVADHFDLINRRFAEKGLHRYEVSNYCKPGHRAVHNSSYWNHGNYLGLGPGAHSFWWGKEAVRWENRADLHSYLKDDFGEVRENTETLDMKQLAEERLMMGLRTREGVSRSKLKEKYDYEFSDRQLEYLERREKKGLIESNGSVRLTDKGIKIADAIILDLITV